MARPYGQYCPIAHALDLVGERWSLLVVRELSHGPLRYSDLLDRLRGCSTNTLAVRLRELEDAGVIARHRLPPPAASMVYELTPVGARLRPVVAALARWGAELLGPPPNDASLQPGWLANALRIAVADAAPSARVTFRIGVETASLAAGIVTDGELDDVDATVDGDAAGFYRFVFEGDAGALSSSGDVTAVETIATALGLARAASVALA
jgi:DNA-binding HxlR family transcriptional regulator